MILGEAKWNSPIGARQGINRDRTQLDLRLKYFERFAPLALPAVRRYIVLGIGRKPEIFSLLSAASDSSAKVLSLAWADVIQCLPSPLREESEQYVVWKEAHGSAAP